MRELLATAAISFALAAAPTSAPAALIVNSSGQLTGATGVDVGGTLYDVDFVEGTCAVLFSGCDEDSDFAISYAQSAAAAQALLDQVFIDGVNGLFDSVPALTFGCSDATTCVAYIPSEPLYATTVYNRVGPDGVGYTSGAMVFDTGQYPAIVYARFSLPGSNSAVPEPATWALMLLGFGGVGFAMRRHRKTIAQIA